MTNAAAATPLSSTPRAWSDEQSKIFEWFKTGRVPARSMPVRGGAGATDWTLPGNDGDALVTSDNLVCRARAGTGKTTTIVEGVKLAPEQKILLAAFNKSIANELQARVNDRRIEAKTLHGLGYKFIARNWSVSLDENSERAYELARMAAPNAPIAITRAIRDLHSKAREVDPLAVNGGWSDVWEVGARFDLLPDDGDMPSGWDTERVCVAALQAMRLATRRTSKIDFADMIFLPIVHNWVRPWFDMVVIDEAQDMTLPQLTIACGAVRRGGRICVVGDNRQAIYGFRGADSGSLDRLRDELGAAELGLATTYRCGRLIVEIAAKIVPDYKAAPGAPDGVIAGCDADTMIARAEEGDFILSRKNGPLVRTCLALLKRGIRARVKGRDLGKGIVAIIRKLNAPNVEAVPPLARAWLAEQCVKARKKLPEEAADAKCEELADQAAVIEALSEDAGDLAQLEAKCTELFSDEFDKKRPPVMCSSIHRSKGLEADRVFILADTLRDGNEEEANIRYVAITRAKTSLTWVSGELSS